MIPFLCVKDFVICSCNMHICICIECLSLSLGTFDYLRIFAPLAHSDELAEFAYSNWVEYDHEIYGRVRNVC